MTKKLLMTPIGFAGLTVLLLSQACMFFQIEPFFTWFYIFSWWSYIVIIDSIIYNFKGNSLIQSRGKEIFILSAWSVVFWLIFEFINFFLKNWYYINLPANDFLRTSGIILAFATVLPGIFETVELIEISAIYSNISTKRFKLSIYLLWLLIFTGAVFASLSLILPIIFFPLIWGSFTLILDPILYLAGGRSLLKDLENGNPRNILLLLTSGLVCGFLWEFWNYWAYSKWIYTIPYLNQAKIFEMPLVGFLGFPPFAIDCYVMYNVVSFLRQGKGWEQAAHPTNCSLPKPLRIFIIPLLMVAFSFTIIKNMEKYTIDSYQSTMKDIPAVSDKAFDYLTVKGLSHIYKFTKFCEIPGNINKISEDTNSNNQTVQKWCRLAKLTEFQGIGAVNVLILNEIGIKTISDLSKTDPEVLFEKFKEKPPARINLWINNAKKVP